MIEKVQNALLNALHENYPIPLVDSNTEYWLAWFLLGTYIDYLYFDHDTPFCNIIKEIQEFTIRDVVECILSFSSRIDWNKIKDNNELRYRIYNIYGNSQLILEGNRGNLSLREAQALFFNYFYEGDVNKVRRIFGYKNVSSINNLLKRAEKKTANGLKSMMIYHINETNPDNYLMPLSFMIRALIILKNKLPKNLSSNYEKIFQEIIETVGKFPTADFETYDIFGEEIGCRGYRHKPIGKNCPVYYKCYSISVNFLDKFQSTGRSETEHKKYLRWIKFNCPRDKDKSIVCSTGATKNNKDVS